MATRYRIGRYRRKRSFHIKGVLAITLLVIVLVAGGVYYISRDQFQASPTQSAVTTVADESKDTITFNEKYFTINLPKYWKLLRSQETPTIQYNYQSMERFASNRFLTIYIDTIPPDFAVTHMLPVSASGNQLQLGSMSGRCSDFTSDIHAKWDGVNFICGIDHQQEYIVGTSSAADGVNRVKLTGKQGSHILFFVYEDQNISPKPEILPDALRTFRLK